MERNLEDAGAREEALEAQEELERVENAARAEPLLVPSFLAEIGRYKCFEKIQTRDRDQETVENLENLALELKRRLNEDILMKSALWIELAKERNTNKGSASKDQKKFDKTKEMGVRSMRPRSGTTPDPRAIGSSEEESAQTKGLSDLEIIRRQILHYYDQTQFQKIVAQKSRIRAGPRSPGTTTGPARPRPGDSNFGILQHELEADNNYQAAYKDYEFMSKFLQTQLFVTFIETELDL